MQNKFIRFGLVLLVLILILPFGFSFLAKDIVIERLESGQRHLEKLYETSALSEKVGVSLSMSLEDYHRGWLTSSGKIRIKLNTFPHHKTMDMDSKTVMPKAMPAIEINIPTTIYHGPLIYMGSKSHGSKIYMGRAAFAGKANMDSLGLGIFKAMFGSEFNPEVEFSSVKGLFGSSEFGTYMKPFDLKVGANKIVWHGYDLKIDESSNQKVLDVLAHLNGLDYKNAALDLDVSMHDIEYKSTCDMQQYDLCQGNTTMTMNGFNVKGQNKNISLDKSFLKGSSAINGEHLNLAVNFRMNQLSIDDQNYDGKLDFDLKHINAKGLQSLNSSLAKMKSGDLNAETILSEMHSLIKEEVSFGINQFLLSTPKGDADLTARLMIQDSRSDVREPLNFANLINEMRLDFSMAKPLAEFVMGQWLFNQMQQQQSTSQAGAQMTPGQMQRMAETNAASVLAEMIKQGFIIEEGDLFKLNISFQKGASFLLNGKNINLSDFGLDI